MIDGFVSDVSLKLELLYMFTPLSRRTYPRNLSHMA